MATTPDSPSTKGVLALIFGVLGILCILPCIGPIVAIALGTGEPDGMARAGMILGWLTLLVYAALGAVLFLFFVVGGIVALHA